MLRPAARSDRVVRRIATGVLCVGVVVSGSGSTALIWRAHHARTPLLSQAVALTADGAPTVLAPGDPRVLQPGTRVLAATSVADLARTTALASAQRQWLDDGTVPGDGGPFGPMVRDALLDLHTLTLASGAALAGGPARWRYVWPRDASFAAVAFARTGHQADALRVLEFLAGMQSADGSFQARYRPDGSGPPDDRGIQEDGPGWVLWATGQVQSTLPAGRRTLPDAVLRMVDLASTRVLTLTHDGATLPPPSSDYWEVPEDTLTLGTVAPMLAGLGAIEPVYRERGDVGRAQLVRVAAARLRTVVEASFGAQGYPRHLGGDAVDAAVTFAMPPFQTRPLAGAGDASIRATRVMRRPAGGLAPGEDWKDDGISWTPETALFALTAAADGRPAQATEWLRWLADHRTVAGALPEKVLSNGEPAAVAPLSWTAALVVLTVGALDQGTGPSTS